MDLPAPVATQIQPPDATRSLNNYLQILSAQQARQQLAIGAQTLKETTAKATSMAQDTAEKMRVAHAVQDPSFLLDETGNLRSDAQERLQRIAPTNWATYAQQAAEASKWNFDFQQARNNLNSNVLREVGSTVAGIAADPDSSEDDAHSALAYLKKSKKGTPFEADYNRLIDQADQKIKDAAEHHDDAVAAIRGKEKGDKEGLSNPDMEPWRRVSMGLARMVMSPTDIAGAGGVGAPRAGMVDVGSGAQPTVTSPVSGRTAAAGPQFMYGLSPNSRFGEMAMPNNQIARLDKATGQYQIFQPGQVVPPSMGGGRAGSFAKIAQAGGQPPEPAATGGQPPQPAGAAQPPQAGPAAGAPQQGAAQPQPQARVRTAEMDAPPPNAPQAVQEQWRKASDAATQHVAATRQADSEYGNSVSIANSIRMLSNDVTTGPGTQAWNTILASLPLQKMGASSGAKYQELGAWLDRQAAVLSTQMGLPATNQGASISQTITGNTQYAREALQAKNDYTQALAEGLHWYRRGLDRVEGFSGQPSPKSVAAYQAAWTNSFDPNIFVLKRAHDAGDAKDLARIESELAKQYGPNYGRILLAKYNALKALSENGQP